MKNGIIHIKVFGILDDIRRMENIKDYAWAKTSGKGVTSSRISEYRAMARGETIKRAFTIKKCSQLMKGLQAHMQTEKLKTEVVKRLNAIDKDISDSDYNHCLLELFNEEQNKTIKDQLRTFAKVFFGLKSV